MRLPGWLFGLFLLGATFLAYLPALPGTLVWDDANWTTDIVGLLKDFSGLCAMWANPVALQQYYPLTGTTFWIDYQLWRFWTLPYHVENVLLHVVAAILFWRLLRRLQVPGACLAAALFALHPVMVESVAWITERKNVLSLVLYLGALLAYGKFTLSWTAPEDDQSAAWAGSRRGRWTAYAVSLLLFLAAMLSKTTAFSLPPVLLLISWWKQGSVRWRRDVIPSLPFFAIAIGLGLFIAWLEKNHVRATGPEFAFSFAERWLIAGRALWFYAGKTFWPTHLCLIYPRWHLDAASLQQWLYPVSAGALFIALWLARKRTGRGPIVAVLFFVGTLLPLIGFANGYFMVLSFVYDHCVYLSSLGFIALGSALVVRAAARLRKPAALYAFAAVVLTVFGILTWRQSGTYASYDTLMLATLERNPASSLPHDSLGGALLAKGQVDEAILHFRKSLETRPLGTFAHNGLGVALIRKGLVDEAFTHFQKVLEIEPNDPMANSNLGNLLLAKGRLDEAIAHFQRSLAVDPGDTATHFSLGNALLLKKQLDEAITQYEASLNADPNNIFVLQRLAHVLATSPEGSIRNGARALELAQRADQLAGGSNAMVAATLAAAWAETGQFSEAVSATERARDLAAARGDTARVEAMRAQLELYRQHKPLRDPSLTNAGAGPDRPQVEK